MQWIVAFSYMKMLFPTCFQFPWLNFILFICVFCSRSVFLHRLVLYIQYEFWFQKCNIRIEILTFCIVFNLACLPNDQMEKNKNPKENQKKRYQSKQVSGFYYFGRFHTLFPFLHCAQNWVRNDMKIEFFSLLMCHLISDQIFSVCCHCRQYRNKMLT